MFFCFFSFLFWDVIFALFKAHSGYPHANRTVLTADKGVALVVMDQEDYQKKAEELLGKTTYSIINQDPTTKYKNRLISLLKSIKAQGGMNEALYKKLYPTGAEVPKFYGLPKVHKKDTPLRPIVSSIGSVSYATSKRAGKNPKTPSWQVLLPCS